MSFVEQWDKLMRALVVRRIATWQEVLTFYSVDDVLAMAADLQETDQAMVKALQEVREGIR